MRTMHVALCCLVLLGAGCRANNSTALLERDLRLQEDKIYHLQSCLQDAQAAREATIRENESLKKQLNEGDRGAGSDSSSDTDRTTPSFQPPSVEPPSVELPGGDLPGSSSGPADSGPPASRGKRERPSLEPPVVELPEASDAPAAEPLQGNDKPGDDKSGAAEGPATQLFINTRLTGGLDRDGAPGDEGLLVVFEPRNAAGQLVRAPGSVSVVVMDPSLEGDAARVARWDFNADEVPSHFHNTVFGRGLQFELPWPAMPPKNRELQVFVRFTTPDGVKLNADTKIGVTPPSDAPGSDRHTKRWSPDEDSSGRKTLRSRLKGRSADRDAGKTSPTARSEAPEWKPFR